MLRVFELVKLRWTVGGASLAANGLLEMRGRVHVAQNPLLPKPDHVALLQVSVAHLIRVQLLHAHGNLVRDVPNVCQSEAGDTLLGARVVKAAISTLHD